MKIYRNLVTGLLAGIPLLLASTSSQAGIFSFRIGYESDDHGYYHYHAPHSSYYSHRYYYHPKVYYYGYAPYSYYGHHYKHKKHHSKKHYSYGRYDRERHGSEYSSHQRHHDYR